MSRFSLVFGLIVLLVLGFMLILGFVNTEVKPVHVEKAMLNEAQAQ